MTDPAYRRCALPHRAPKANTLSRRRLHVLLWYRLQALETLVEAYKQVKLIGLFRHGVAAQTQIRIADLPLKVTDDRLEGHSGINEVLHHYFRENELSKGDPSLI